MAQTLLRRCLKWLGLHPRPPGASRRRSTRFDCCLQGACSLVANVQGENWPATVRNLSVEGIGMVVSRSFEAGTRLRVVLQNPRKNVSCAMIVRVVYTLQHPGGDWILGGQFSRPLTGAELQSLLD